MKSNTLDKVIGWFDPARGFKRARYRAAIELQHSVHASYDGAKTGRRTAGWLTSGASANVEVGQDLVLLRQRAHELVRNNYAAQNAQAKWRECIIGTGILCFWEDQNIQELWDAWCASCSADGLPGGFEAIQAISCDTEWESGEVLIRKRQRRGSDGIWPPFQLQVLEPDYLDMSKTGTTQGGYIIHGVEFDLRGNRVAYWLFGQHPGDVVNTGVRLGAGLQSSRIPASEVLHIAEVKRPGQVRGVPRLSPVMMTMRDIDDWEDAELMRKKTEACIVGNIQSIEGPEFQFSSEVLDAGGNKVTQFEPGMLLKTQPGEAFTVSQPNYAGGYREYKSSRQRDLAAGLGITFELMTGNYTEGNYSNSRMGAVALGRTVESKQYLMWIPGLCEPVAQEFLRQLALFGDRFTNTAHRWNPPRFELLDRGAEADADETELRIGTTAWDDAVARKGLDPEKQLSLIKKRKADLDAAGVSFGVKQIQPAQTKGGSDAKQN